MNDTQLGVAQTDAREAMLQCWTAREDLAAGDTAQAKMAAQTALDYALSAAQTLTQALGYVDLLALVEAAIIEAAKRRASRGG
jgi:dihydroxyacetone kinase DhaKLM complex PTS-EIIA-like component DhaM